ncbi:hypothetical protein SDC9_185471 [bioreactor metagenome]|uniref:Major facilitator superfamily (MFS) profile domain-containing protein n=1 Tax=bioreactor metagenome TaxID=1076179 RepID=A0A645HGU1_9ZZZZ
MFIKEAELFLELDIGDASIAGLSQSVLTIGSFIGGLFMAFVYKRLKSFINFFCWVLVLAGTSIILLTGNLPLIYLGSLIFGFGYGTFFPWLFAKGAMIAAPGTETKSLSYINAVYYLGMFLAVFFYQLISIIFQNDTAFFAISCMIVGCIILSAIFLVKGFTEKKQETGEGIKEAIKEAS